MRNWTKEAREAQSMLIRRHKPWEKSCGPKTKEGKEKSKMNAYKHGGKSEETRFARALIKKLSSRE
jgi:hypothetical protein